VGTLKPDVAHLTGEAKLDVQEKQGSAAFMVEMKITDDNGKRLPWDGKTFGRLKVKGPAISKSYFKGEGGNILDEEGFFDTGDVAHIDEYGYMKITDRAKDVIKSGGEWISSVDLENQLMAHPEVIEAAVIGVPDSRWDERPLACVVLREGASVRPEELRAFLTDRVARWWLPSKWAFIEQVPKTSVGKFDKKVLRARYGDEALRVVDLDAKSGTQAAS
jgi:fatty-acyl-CoA synthase